MLTEIFYDPKSMQCMAVYENCRYSGKFWQGEGYKSALVANGVQVSRDHVVTLGDIQIGEDKKGKPINGHGVVAAAERVNKVQPATENTDPEPTEFEVLIEAAKEAGITLDLDGARGRLKSKKRKT